MAQVGFKAANTRYKRAFWPLIFVYVVICFAGLFLAFRADDPSVLVRIGIALLNGLPIAGVFWVMFRAAEETDEFTSRQQYKAMAFGGAVAAGLGVIAGFLQLYDVLGEVWVFWVGPAFFFAYGLAQCRMRWMAGRSAA